MEELVFLQLVIRQAGAVDEQFDTAHGFGLVAVIHTHQAQHDHIAVGTGGENLVAFALGVMEYAVIGERCRVLGIGLYPHLTPDSLRGADHADENGVLQRLHGSMSFRRRRFDSSDVRDCARRGPRRQVGRPFRYRKAARCHCLERASDYSAAASSAGASSAGAAAASAAAAAASSSLALRSASRS